MKKKIVLILSTILLLTISLHSQNKKAIYWRGDLIKGDISKITDIVNRGFTHVVVHSDEGSLSSIISDFNSYGLSVILNLHRNHSLKITSPFVDASGYYSKLQTLQSLINTNASNISGFVDDIEISPFNKTIYNQNGGKNTWDTIIYDEDRITNGVTNPNFEDRIAFDEFTNRWGSNVSQQQLQFNNPMLDVTNIQTGINKGFLFGWYGPANPGGGATAGNYHRVVQSFTPTQPRLARIDIKIKRWDDGTGSFPYSNHIKYYIVNVSNDVPQLSSRVGQIYYLKNNQFDYGGNNQDDFNFMTDYVKLYFNPNDIGALNTGQKYALVLEYGTSNYTDEMVNGWNDYHKSHYRVAVHANSSSDPYTRGELFKGHVDGWLTEYPNEDICFMVYYTTTNYSGDYNKMHSDWIDYQALNMSLVVQDYENIKGSEELYIYSGYKNKYYFGETTKERYSVDWDEMADKIDYAICGYGYDTDAMDDTKSAIGSKPLIGGVLDDMAYFAQTYSYCDGGVMYGYWSTQDQGYSVPTILPKVSNNEMKLTNYLLNQNYPNPFNPTTNISYQLPENSHVKIIVYNSIGQEIRRLVSEYQEKGSHNIKFDGSDLSSGIYYYKMITGTKILTNKMMLIK